MNAIGGYNWFRFIYCTLFLNINLFSLILDISSVNEMDEHSFIMCPLIGEAMLGEIILHSLSYLFSHTLISLIWYRS